LQDDEGAIVAWCCLIQFVVLLFCGCDSFRCWYLLCKVKFCVDWCEREKLIDAREKIEDTACAEPMHVWRGHENCTGITHMMTKSSSSGQIIIAPCSISATVYLPIVPRKHPGRTQFLPSYCTVCRNNK
jgi:hypothetical protein